MTPRQNTELTRRESEVARWVMNGATDDQIARIMGISRGTVHNMLTNAYRKMDIHLPAGCARAMLAAKVASQIQRTFAEMQGEEK